MMKQVIAAHSALSFRKTNYISCQFAFFLLKKFGLTNDRMIDMSTIKFRNNVICKYFPSSCC